MSSQSTVEASAPEASPRRERVWVAEVREIIAVFVLSVTAILTAWCGFESSKWGGEMSILFSEASAARIEASDASGRSRDARSVDLAIYTQWVDARAAGDSTLESYVQARFTPEFAIAFDDWQTDGETLPSPFAEPTYAPAGEADAAALSDKADTAFAGALESNQRGDNYSMLTVLFALVLFFSAMSSRNRFPWVDWVLLGFAVALATAGCVILAGFPVLV